MILVDTGPLVALCDARDRKHGTAVTQLSELTGERLATCEAVLTEACFHLPHRSQRLRLGLLLHELDVRNAAHPDDATLWIDVLEWLSTYADHEPDWADGCLAVLSSRDRLAQVWTFDQEFVTIWRRTDGTPIPTTRSLKRRGRRTKGRGGRS